MADFLQGRPPPSPPPPIVPSLPPTAPSLPSFDDIIRIVGGAALRVSAKKDRKRRRQPAQMPVKDWLAKRYPDGVPESKTDTVLVHEASKDGVATGIDAMRRATGRKR